MMIKDPRLCMTLPFWRDAVPAPMAAVLVLRKPLSVARSLEARDGMQMTLGLAIWDRSMRSADLVLEGLPTLVVNYDDMMADPSGATEEFVRFLERVDVEVAPGLGDAAARQLDTGLHHQKAEDDEYRDFAGVQTDMFAALLERKGIHDAWKPVSSFAPPPLWVEDTLEPPAQFDENDSSTAKAARHHAEPDHGAPITALGRRYGRVVGDGFAGLSLPHYAG